MKFRTHLLCCVLLVACVAGVMLFALPRSATAAGDRPGDEGKALMKLDDEWSAAAVARDINKVASFYADDANAYPPGEPMVQGREAAKKVWAAYFAEPSLKISWKATRGEVSGDLGFTAGTYDLSVNGPDGKMVHEKGKFLCVWKKQKDGSWKASQDMWNADSK